MKQLLLAAWLLSGCATHSAQVRPYALSTCIVTDNALGSMGDPITKVYNGQEVKFCCRPCIKEFEAEPARFLGKLDTAR